MTRKKTTILISLLKTIGVFASLYIFLISIGLIAAGFKGFGKGYAEALIQGSGGPLLGLIIGILATSLIQSSSTTTSIIVTMVAGNAFGTDVSVAIATAIPFIMGANVGTSVTNTIVSLGHIGNKLEFERAFSASIVHDFFNLFSVLILFPIQVSTNIIGKSAEFLTTLFVGSGTVSFHSPIKAITKPLVKFIVHSLDGIEFINYHFVILALAIVLLFLSLRYLMLLIRSLVMSKLEAFFDAHIFKTWGRAMFFGVFITILVQSSSITTSLIIPLAGAGILTLQQIFPYTLGANIGTTITAILASLALGTYAPLAVAFSHLLFNIFGILIIWPVPFIRNIPINLAQKLSALTVKNRVYSIAYVLVVFFVIPISLIFILR